MRNRNIAAGLTAISAMLHTSKHWNGYTPKDANKVLVHKKIRRRIANESKRVNRNK